MHGLRGWFPPFDAFGVDFRGSGLGVAMNAHDPILAAALLRWQVSGSLVDIVARKMI